MRSDLQYRTPEKRWFVSKEVLDYISNEAKSFGWDRSFIAGNQCFLISFPLKDYSDAREAMDAKTLLRAIFVLWNLFGLQQVVVHVCP